MLRRPHRGDRSKTGKPSCFGLGLGFLHSARGKSPVNSRPWTRRFSDPLVGHVLDGRYRVESRIARGGMASVYLALDVRLDRMVAIKVMHRSLAEDPEFVRRFIGEAKSVASLSHPNIVHVFDQGTDGDHVYLSMEYFPGKTLRAVLDERGRWPRARRWRS